MSPSGLVRKAIGQQVTYVGRKVFAVVAEVTTRATSRAVTRAARRRVVISEKTRQKILRLLARGETQTAIARKTGVCRQTVGSVKARSLGPKSLSLSPPQFRSCPRYWCDPCGAWINVRPCPACLARAKLAEEAVRREAEKN